MEHDRRRQFMTRKSFDPNVRDDAPSVFDHVTPRQWPEPTALETEGEEESG